MKSRPILSQKIRVARLRVGMTQVDLAVASGVGDKVIASFECGSRIGSLKFTQLEAICAALSCDLADFIAWEPTMYEIAEFAINSQTTLVAREARRTQPADPLRGFTRSDRSPYPTPQSSLGKSQFAKLQSVGAR